MEPILVPQTLYPSSRSTYAPQTYSAPAAHPMTARRSCDERDYTERHRASAAIGYRRANRKRFHGELVEAAPGLRHDHTYILDLTLHDGAFKIGHSCNPEIRATTLGPAYGPGAVLETWPVDFERAILDGLAGTLGRLRAEKQIHRTKESFLTTGTPTDAASGVFYSLLTHPERHGFTLIEPPVTWGRGRPVWSATEYQIPTLRGGVVTVWIVGGTAVPLIPMHTLNSVGVYFEDIFAEQECRPQYYTSPGTARTMFHDVGRAVPLWRAVDGVLDSAAARHITGAAEIASRLVWAAARAATLVEQERYGTAAYTSLGAPAPITTTVH